MSIYFCFFSEKSFLLSRVEILTGPLLAKDLAMLSGPWLYFSVSEVFIGQSRETGGKDIPEKGLRKVYFCNSERMASSSCGARRALAQFLHGCLRPYSGRGGARRQFEDAASCELICRGCASLSVARARQGSHMTRRLKVISGSAGAFSKILVQKYPIER